ncbi:MAG: MGMT family protein [Dehalococcoidia bacterium]|nr:MGMT family protein [Dehalococcoidia bacterium]
MGRSLRKSWRDKLADSKDLPRVVEINDRMSQRWGVGTCVIPAPLEVDELMRKVPRGKLTTINEIRAALAWRHGATIGCPITTGIFAGIAARAAEEAAAEGKRNITPYWRTLKSGGDLNPKYPGGAEAQAARLKDEGHAVELGRDKRPKRVKGFKKSLVKL